MPRLGADGYAGSKKIVYISKDTVLLVTILCWRIWEESGNGL